MEGHIQCIQCGSWHYEKPRHITEDFIKNYVCADCERAALPIKCLWVKVKDKLPEYCEPVLIWSKGMSVTGAYLMECNLWSIIDWDEYDQHLRLDHVEYWHPTIEPAN